MAEAHRICTIPNCGKKHKGHGLCGMHLLRQRKYGDPHYVVPVSQRDYSHNGRPRKHHVDPAWLRQVYEIDQWRIGDIAAHIGCSITHLNEMVTKHGIPRRDGRAGRMVAVRRSTFDLQRAMWLYEIERKNCADIGAELGVNGCTVRRRLREAGVTIRHHNDTKRGAPSPHRAKLDGKKVVREYLKEGATLGTVGAKFGVSYGVIGRILDEHKVKRKGYDELRDWKGEKHPQYRHDMSQEERETHRNEQPAWRIKVFKRDGFKCQACGCGRGGNLQAHHIVAHNENKELRWELSNGVTLCADCHKAFHRKYGMRGFGRDKLAEFIAAYAVPIAS